MIPEWLKMNLDQLARRETISLGELIRRALGRYVTARKGGESQDPFFASRTVFEDKGPRDVSSTHDETLSRRGPH